MRKIYQQGDILIEEYNGNVKGNILPHLILAEGEATGHKHEVIGNASLISAPKGLFLKIIRDKAIVKHPEHFQLTLDKGVYEIRHVQEYDHFSEEARQVKD